MKKEIGQEVAVIVSSYNSTISNTKNVTRINVDFGTTAEQIINMANANGCQWVVCFKDHYAGNGKGVFYDLNTLAKEEQFSWSVDPSDRGIMTCYITDEDIPSVIEARRNLVAELNSLDCAMDQLIRSTSRRESIDNRWGANNPKRLAAEASNQTQSKKINEGLAPLNARKEAVLEQLKQTDHVSSTMHQVRF